ncbi:histidine kinase [uncultured Erythrobacter sp.]|uniref:sensor histidine kinase n=1 Tax=uncultured Erythrobacter sp. TaxID=263913 RepID=UPI00262BD234|nr:histidine kinase [uncultured Erythrobacter sp.]
MRDTLPLLPSDGETIAELRELYRAAESRAARLRLLSVSARELAEANSLTLDEVIERCAQRLAFFVGCRSAVVLQVEAQASNENAIPITAAGDDSKAIAWLVVDGLSGIDAIPDEEDRDAFRMELDQLGLTIDRITKDRERGELLSKLQEREQTLGMLLDQIFTAQEEERRRVSHELHDGVAQTATALVRILESPAVVAGQVDGGVNPAEVARSLVAELRRVIAGLRPTLLDDLGLISALQALAENLAAEGYSVTQEFSQGDQRLAPVVETAIFRVAQEAVANIRKHAGGPCNVTLVARLDTDPLLLMIEDEGVGPSDETKITGMLSGNSVGIEVMKERMASIGGSLDWGAGDESGVFVKASFPAQF